MGELLRVGEPVAPFTLPVAGSSSATLYSKEIVGRRRVALMVLSAAAGPGDAGLAWVRAASGRAEELNARELTVLVITTRPEAVPELLDLPVPAFQVLRDAYDEEAARLGGAPAFYLLGRGTTIQRASREFPPLDELFAWMDSLPTRGAEAAGEPA